MSRQRKSFLNECRKFFPVCDAVQAHDLFWEGTPFPAAPIETCREALKSLSHRSNRDPDKALDLARQDFANFLEEMKGRTLVNEGSTEQVLLS